MTEEADGVVLDFRIPDGPPVKPRPRDYSRARCSHGYAEYCTVEHRLYCQKCKADIDPLRWLVEHSGDWKHWWDRMKASRVELNANLESIAKAKKELKSLDAKIERRKAKLEAAP